MRLQVILRISPSPKCHILISLEKRKVSNEQLGKTVDDDRSQISHSTSVSFILIHEEPSFVETTCTFQIALATTSG